MGAAILYLNWNWTSGLQTGIHGGVQANLSWPLDIGFKSASVAIAFAYGLTLYRGSAVRAATVAGSTVFIAELLPAAIVAWSLYVLAGATDLRWLAIALPCAVAAMAIFEPTFRRPSIWLLAVAAYVVPAYLLFYFPIGMTTATLLIPFFLFCALLGLALQRAASREDAAGPLFDSAALTLGLLAFATFYLVEIWLDTAATTAWSSYETPWPVPLAIEAVALAILLAGGLRRYAGVESGQAVRAGMMIFVLQFAVRAAGMSILLWNGVALVTANNWEGILLGPCAVAGLMLYDRAFRSVPIALLFTALYVIPSVGLAWIRDNDLIPAHWPALPLTNLAYVTTAALWIAAVGYQLQWAHRASAPKPSGSDGLAARPIGP